MNRLQKKCLIVSAATHGLLLLVLLVGPAFFTSPDRPDSSHLIHMIAGTTVDNAMSSGGRPNTEVTQAQMQPQPQPQPQPEVKPEAIKSVEPVKPLPPPKITERPKPPVTPDFTPVKPQKPVPEKLKSDDFQIVNHPPVKPQNSPKPSPVKNPADSKPVQVADNSRQIASALGNIKSLQNGLSSGAKIELSGQGSDSDASNYGDIVYSKYYFAWTPPVNTLKDSGTVTVRVTIARDGRVTARQILTRSGDVAIDKSIQTTLDNVVYIEPFPANSKDLERVFTIQFDLAAKRAL